MLDLNLKNEKRFKVFEQVFRENGGEGRGGGVHGGMGITRIIFKSSSSSLKKELEQDRSRDG